MLYYIILAISVPDVKSVLHPASFATICVISHGKRFSLKN